MSQNDYSTSSYTTVNPTIDPISALKLCSKLFTSALLALSSVSSKLLLRVLIDSNLHNEMLIFFSFVPIQGVFFSKYNF